MGEVFSIKTGQRVPITMTEYTRMLDTFERYCGIIRETRGDKTLYREALNIAKEIRFCAYFNHQFREETRDQLRTILDDLYILVNN